MKTPRAGALLWLAACVSASLFLNGCGDAKYVKRTSDNPDKQEQLTWNYQATVEVYQKSKYKSFRWNQQAVTALAEFACYRAGVCASNEPSDKIIADNVAAAVRKGCKDPLVNYLYIVFAMPQTNSKEAFTDAFYQTAMAMEASPYPDTRKYYAGLKAIQQYRWARKNPTDWTPEMGSLCKQIEDNLFNMLGDSHTPRAEVYDACHEYLDLWSGSKENYPKLWTRMEPLVFQSWADDETMWLLKAGACYRMAWLARGGGYADKVTDDQWRDFRNDLAGAETAAKKAWSLNPDDVRIPNLMIKIDEGQSKDRSDMELWFGRAMQLNPNNYDACSAKLHYLYPQWYGSREDMLAFGRECVAATNWGGHVPLILLDAHREYQMFLSGDDKNNYWMQPDVWPDLKSAFDRFFELNPDEVGWHHNYAWHAYACGQWSEFLHQTTLFSDGTNYDYFGGKQAFDNMVTTAKANAH